MSRLFCVAQVAVVIHFATLAISVLAEDKLTQERLGMYQRFSKFSSYVNGGRVTPNWMEDGNSFWFVDEVPGNKVIYKVDPVANTKDVISQPPSETDSKRRPVPRGAWTRREVLSPDGLWFVGVKDFNLYLRSAADSRVVTLTSNGEADHQWGYQAAGFRFIPKWSPDSSKLAVTRFDSRKVPKVPVVDYIGETGRVRMVHYPTAGEPRTKVELYVIDVHTKRQVPVDIPDSADPTATDSITLVGWTPDGSELIFRADRFWQPKCDVAVANPVTGTVRVLVNNKPHVRHVEVVGGDHLVLSVRGWKPVWQLSPQSMDAIEEPQILLYGLNGTLTRRLSPKHLWPLEVLAVDQDGPWIYFTAVDSQKPTGGTHLYRVDFEGQNIGKLSETVGQHRFLFSPSKQFFLDAHSTPLEPPIVELRRANGTLLQRLSTASIRSLKQELKWIPPEPFVVTAADGETTLHGLLYKPFDFDPTKKYPVIDTLSTPEGGFLSTTRMAAQAMAQLGFITIEVNARVSRGKIGSTEIPDHVAALRQLAESRPYMDMSRVGVSGRSYQGYLALHAMLTEPNVYMVGVARYPITDQTQHAWNIQLVGRQDEEVYEYVSQTRRASNLSGKLLLMHGTSDTAVPMFHTMRMVKALNDAGKSYQLLILPGSHHFSAETPIEISHMQRFFVENLKP